VGSAARRGDASAGCAGAGKQEGFIMVSVQFRSRFAGGLAAVALVAAVASIASISVATGGSDGQRSKAVQAVNPILFVTQVPLPSGDAFASRSSTFANHLPSMDSVPRGGDLMIRYPNGTLRNLTRDAGYGDAGVQQGANAIAVREPHVHWSGTKALFSMVIGAPAAQYQIINTSWQLYEITGIGQGQTAVITKVPGQPQGNNVSPLYDSSDNILFTSDAPRDGQAHLHPQLDEYESTPTITGLWRIERPSNRLRILNHTPSGLFSPSIDSYGRLIFIRWDHLQRDQQADGSPGNGYQPQMFASEAPGAAVLAPNALHNEVFPERRMNHSSPVYGPVMGFTFNLFQPWEMNQDGTAELTMNHMGRHELSFGYLGRSFTNDPALSDNSAGPIANTRYVRGDGGLLQIKEDPTLPGRYYATYSREFGTVSSGNLLRFNAGPTLNAEQISLADLTPPEDQNNSIPGGRLRDPLPLSDGSILASHANLGRVQLNNNPPIQFQIKEMIASNGGNTLTPGQSLTGGISRSVSWWSPDNPVSYNGPLWELEPVEVVARVRPTPRVTPIESVEKQVLNEESVDESALRAWLKKQNLALIVTRNHTSRDRGDKQQPFNLRVPGGVQTTVGVNPIIYDIAHYQILQGDRVRGYVDKQGRRVIATPIPAAINPPTSGPAGSVPIALDGSSAAFVPAGKALAWQTTNPGGEPVVRERVWVTMQAGEIRTCAGCHGENARNQANQVAATNKPEALRALLQYWKSNNATVAALPLDIDGNGSCDAATDAQLILRYLNGVRGAALVQGINFGSGTTRSSAADVAAYLAGLGSTLDIDGDGIVSPLTDGLLYWRYATSLTGSLLTTSIRAPFGGLGIRSDSEIQTYLATRCTLP